MCSEESNGVFEYDKERLTSDAVLTHYNEDLSYKYL